MQITNKLPLSPAPAPLSPFLIFYRSRWTAAAGAVAGRRRAGAAGAGGRGFPPGWGLLPSAAGAGAAPGVLRDGPAAPVLWDPVPELGSPQALRPPAPRQDPHVPPLLPCPHVPSVPTARARWPHTRSPRTHRVAGAGMQPARPRLAAQTPRLELQPCQRSASPATSPATSLASLGEGTGTGICR